MLRHLISGGDLSGYGLVNAVTHYSQEVGDYDRATDFEMLVCRLSNSYSFDAGGSTCRAIA